MSEANAAFRTSLLPNGLRDLLPPDAAHEASVLQNLLTVFQSFGYERVDPPLVEFEDNLLQGVGAAAARHTFRLMDPVSQRMMGLRADITPQIARIAASRLGGAPRPLRLTYAGAVLRVRGAQLRPERQFQEAGCELIGVDSPEADAEVIVAAATALDAVGVQGLSIDITLPTLTPHLCHELGVDPERAYEALDRKDAAAVLALDPAAGPMLRDLLAASGPAEQAIPTLKALDLPEICRADCARLEAVVAAVARDLPDLAITVDPVEHRGLEYQQGVSFTLFARAARGELGRGGRYRIGAPIGDGTGAETEGEPATGFTLYLDTILRAAAAPASITRALAAPDTPMAVLDRLRAEDWVVARDLQDGDADLKARARALGYSHIVVGDTPVAVSDVGV
ncbi:MAG: ATP phosphoribosyltransferase regulatory subunit [Alphaproteobacteria bacterium]|nr:ATP phosphoribosyltransferase regulatory subunit [Alphaproteobacteria bacterium]